MQNTWKQMISLSCSRSVFAVRLKIPSENSGVMSLTFVALDVYSKYKLLSLSSNIHILRQL
jgi:hypothetical protein